MKKYLCALSLALLSILNAHADEALIARPEVRDYIREMVAKHQFDEAELINLFTRVEPKPHILNFFDRPSTSRPWYQFRSNFVNTQRIDAGAKFWREHAQLLNEISNAYQVDPAVIVAILDVETFFGKNTGSFRVLDVLATTAFDYPRRADFFRKEMTEFLLLARGEKEDPLSFKGSYAGAMGWPQFMPSSFRAYAVDWDSDGHHDIWNSPADAIASVASYLALHGWSASSQTYVPVNVVPGEAIDKLIEDKFNLHYTVAELIGMGVQATTILDGNQAAVLFVLEGAPEQQQYYLGFKNFYAITRYNKSTLYATAVLQLAEEIRASYLANPKTSAAPPVVAKSKKTTSAKKISTTGSHKKTKAKTVK